MNIYGLDIETNETYEKETILLNFVYLHGILEKRNGFDLVGVTKETNNVIESCDFGKFDVNIIFPNSEKEQGVLFYWHGKNGIGRGLIVSEMDEESMNYAREKFDKRVSVL